MESLEWVSSSSSEAILATAGGVAGQAEDFISIRGRLSHDRRHLGDIPLGESRTGNRCVFCFVLAPAKSLLPPSLFPVSFVCFGATFVGVNFLGISSASVLQSQYFYYLFWLRVKLVWNHREISNWNLVPMLYRISGLCIAKFEKQNCKQGSPRFLVLKI